jgi:uncharacterized protein (DUF1501 family)
VSLSRRAFLGLGGGAAAAAVGGGLAWRALVDDSIDRSMGHDGSGGPSATTIDASGLHPGRVLVVVQLGGGNDGLNTLVPAGDGRYYDRRPTLAVPEGDVVALPGVAGYGLNPALAPLVPHWSQGRLAAVEGVGFPGQSRSHFQAMDTWWTGSPDHTVRTGWLGRWLDAVGAVDDPLRAVAIGAGSPALVGEHAQSTVVLDPAGFALSTPDGVDAEQRGHAFRATAAPLSSDPTVAAAQRAVPGTLDAVQVLAPALARDDGDGGDVEAGDLTTGLRAAGRILGLGLSTQNVMVSVSGFDTQAGEADAHPALLADLAVGLDDLLRTVEQQGRADDVLVVTTSEFGRRVQENGSGTDDGKASVARLAGAPVAAAPGPDGAVSGGRLVGEADLGALDDGDLPVAVDTRCLYAAALDWLGGPTDDLLGGPYDRHALIRA